MSYFPDFDGSSWNNSSSPPAVALAASRPTASGESLVRDTAFEGGLSAPSDKMVGLVFVKGGAGVDVCGGVVSSKSGAFWCTKGAECTTVSHGTKMSLSQNHVYIRATGTVQKAEFEHSLDATQLEGNLNDWLAEKRSTIQWRSIFKTQEERSGDVNGDESSDLWTEIGLGMGDSQNRGVSKQLFDSSGDVKDILPTPFKKTKGSMSTETVSSKPLHDGRWEPMIPSLNNTSSVEFCEFKLPIEEWTSSIPLIESTINRIHHDQREDQNWSTVELERVFGGLNEIGFTVSTIDQKVVLLSLLVGKRPKHLSNDHEIITLWDAIDRALSNIVHMEEGMIQDQEHWIATDGRLSILEQTLAPRISQLDATVEKIGMSLRNQFTVALKDLDGRTRVLRPDRASGKTLVDRIVALELNDGANKSVDPFDLGSLGISLEDPEVSTLKQKVEDQEKKMERMMERIVQLEHGLQTMSLGGGHTTSSLPQTMPPSSALKDLMARISDLEVNNDKTTVQISGYKFSGLSDCRRFIHEETTNQRFDTFYDMISLLHRVGAPSVTISETLKEQDQLARAGHASRGSAVIISSFQTKIPACLAKGGTASTATVPIPGLPNVEMWGLSSRDGARKTISSSVTTIVLNVKSTIQMDVVRPTGRLVANAMLDGSREHWDEICRFLTDTFHLLENSGPSTSASRVRNWALVCRVVFRVLDTLHATRALGADLNLLLGTEVDVGQRTQFAARILWSSLQCHRFMEEVVTVGLANHPLAVAEFTNHLVENHVYPSQLEATITTVSKLDAKVNKLTQKGS